MNKDQKEAITICMYVFVVGVILVDYVSTNNNLIYSLLVKLTEVLG